MKKKFECDCRPTENGHGVKCASRKATYPEIWRPINATPEFPKECPACGAPYREMTVNTAWNNRCRVEYECGGTYTMKPQIQNHTDKWWGRCGLAKD